MLKKSTSTPPQPYTAHTVSKTTASNDAVVLFSTSELQRTAVECLTIAAVFDRLSESILVANEPRRVRLAMSFVAAAVRELDYGTTARIDGTREIPFDAAS